LSISLGGQGSGEEVTAKCEKGGKEKKKTESFQKKNLCRFVQRDLRRKRGRAGGRKGIKNASLGVKKNKAIEKKQTVQKKRLDGRECPTKTRSG